jgi:hypothetical protein
MNLELINISDYKKKFSHLSSKEKMKAIVFDLQQKLETSCPK